VRALNPELPVFLLGASMGGCLCSRVGEQISTTSPMDGVILLCPALNVDKVNKILSYFYFILTNNYNLKRNPAADT